MSFMNDLYSLACLSSLVKQSQTFNNNTAQNFISDVENLKNQITFAIEQITLQGMSSKVDGNMKISTSILNENSHNLNSQEGLVKEYRKLQIQLKQLKILEKRIKKQLDELKDTEENLLEDIRKYSNLNSLREEYAIKYEEISTALQELKDKKRVTESVVEDSEKRYKALKVRLNKLMLIGIIEKFDLKIESCE